MTMKWPKKKQTRDYGEKIFDDFNIGSEVECSSETTATFNSCVEVPKFVSVKKPPNVKVNTVSEKNIVNKKNTANKKKHYVSVGTQTKYSLFSIDNFIDRPEVIQYYTGLESFEKFVFVLNSLGPAAFELKYRWKLVGNLSVQDQLFMTLIKLRRAIPDMGLAIQFDVSEKTVSNVVVTWINFMFLELSELNIWPNRDLVSYFMPEGFRRNYPSTRVIVDDTEIPIVKPSKPVAQQASFSTYKNRNTIKVMIGASPGCLITHCSPAYGGSVSDRAIVERSDLVEKCDEDDSVMADRGFTVQDLFAPKNIIINIPHFLKGKSQLPGCIERSKASQQKSSY